MPSTGGERGCCAGTIPPLVGLADDGQLLWGQQTVATDVTSFVVRHEEIRTVAERSAVSVAAGATASIKPEESHAFLLGEAAWT